MLNTIIRLELFSVKPEDSVTRIVDLMKNRNIGSVLVCDDQQKPVGIVTDRDIVLRCIGEQKDFKTCNASDLMTPAPKVVRETDGIYDCITAMHDAQVRRIPVVDAQGKALGIISFGDLLKILSKEFSNLIETTTHPLEGEERLKKELAA